jgi:hypothetical protein
MSVRQLFMAGLAGSLLFWGAAWGQQDPNPARASSANQSQTMAPGSSATTENSSDTTGTAKEKEKRWSGSLVDVPCMVRVLKTENQGASPDTGSSPSVPHYMGSGLRVKRANNRERERLRERRRQGRAEPQRPWDHQARLQTRVQPPTAA